MKPHTQTTDSLGSQWYWIMNSQMSSIGWNLLGSIKAVCAHFYSDLGPLFLILGTLRSEDGGGRENVAEKANSRSFNLHRSYSKSLTLSNVGEPSKSWIPKNHIQVQKERGNFVVACVLPLYVVKLGIFTSWCTCKIVVLLINPIVFAAFPFPSPLSDLKVPIFV